MPWRIPDYPDAFAYWNHIATMGYGVMGLGVIGFFINLFVSLAAGRKAGDNPWGEGATTLEWTLSSRSAEHTSELQSLMRISYAVFCLKNKNTTYHNTSIIVIITHTDVL